MKTNHKKARRPEPREFNITGSIIPEEHYYVDLKPVLKKLMLLIAKKKYFVINRPRQCGKTTLLNFIAQGLQKTGEYAPTLISFESFTQRADITEASFYLEISQLISEELSFSEEDRKRGEAGINSRRDFFNWLRELCKSRKLVLLIDEIDAAPENVIIGFLAGLREMYLERSRGRKPAPHAVALAGVHDIKNLKARYRDETQTIGSASPFNIAMDYELPAFSLKDIRKYYAQHTEATGQEFDEKVFSRVHEVTSGHPWLVSVLAKLLVEEIAPKRKQKIGLAHVEAAIQDLLSTPNANFDSLFKNAYNVDLFPIVLNLLTGESREYNILAKNISLGVKYGIFAGKERQLILANPIYAQALYKHFKEELEGSGLNALVAANRAQGANGHLDFRRVLDKFQAFMKAKGVEVSKHHSFREATGQLLLLSYLDLLVNGKGWTFKEVQSGE
ncbi:MAG: AAA-like domain-containing protein, partial [candidate division KSB1 bacterium]